MIQLLLNEINNVFFSLMGCQNQDDQFEELSSRIEGLKVNGETYGSPVIRYNDPDPGYNKWVTNSTAPPNQRTIYLRKSADEEEYCFTKHSSIASNPFKVVRSGPSNSEFPYLVSNDPDLNSGVVVSYSKLFIKTGDINYKSGATLQNLFIVGPWLPGNAAPSSGYSTLKFVVNSTGTAPSTIHAGTITYSATGGPGSGPIYYLTPSGGTASSSSVGLEKGIIYTFTIDASAQNANRFRITTDRPTYISGVFQNTGYPAYAELDSDVNPGITPGPITATSTTLTIDTTQINYPSGSTEREIFLIGPVSASGSGSDAPSSGKYTTWPFKINAAGTN